MTLTQWSPHEVGRSKLTERLVEELRARRPEALDELLRRYGAEIQAVAFLIVRNESDAEEILSDTLFSAWRKIDALHDPKALRAWLLTIATRASLRRRRGFQPRFVSLDAAEQVTARDPSPIDRLMLARAIDQLPPAMRAVVALRYVADLSVVDIAKSVGRSENTVKTQLREARVRLRAALADESPGGALEGEHP